MKILGLITWIHWNLTVDTVCCVTISIYLMISGSLYTTETLSTLDERAQRSWYILYDVMQFV